MTSDASQDVLATLPERARFVADPRGQTTHVVIPYDDYMHILAQQAAIAAVPMLEDPNTEWIDLEDALVEFAAPNLARHRKAKGLTQKQLGAKMGVPQSQIARMERDPESMTYKTLKRVAKALGMSIPELVG